MYILKNKLIKPVPIETNKFNRISGDVRHYPPANREWSDSIYAYNKNTVKLLPVANSFVVKLIRDYFNSYCVKFERRMRFPKLRKWMRRLSSTRILISKAQLKHTNNKVIITVYVYNRQKTYYINKLKRLYNLIKLKKRTLNYKLSLTKLISCKSATNLTENKELLINKLNISKTIFNAYENKSLTIYINKQFKSEMRYLYTLRSMLLNKFKFKSIYISRLSSIIKNIFNKKIEFNFVNQKYFYLNSDILLQVVAIKLRKRKNVVRVLTTAINGVSKINLTKLQILRGATMKYLQHNTSKQLQNIKITDNIMNNNTDQINNKLKEPFFLNKDKLNFSDSHTKKEQIISKAELEHAVINSLKYKSLAGIRLEASGRLTRRMTAARCVYKVKYAGNIRNFDSSSLGHSAVILRGNLKSSLQFNKLKSKTRIGSFGLKGWINGI